MNEFTLDLETIRARAREHISQGAVTAAYGADRAQVIKVLNDVLATEIVCVLRYQNHHFMAKGLLGVSAAAEFLAHAKEEQAHVDLVAKRIAQLGGVPNFDPNGLHTRSHSQYTEGKTLDEMIRDNLIAERVAIATYSELVRWLGNRDATTRVMMEGLLATEEEHASDLATVLIRVGP